MMSANLHDTSSAEWRGSRGARWLYLGGEGGCHVVAFHDDPTELLASICAAYGATRPEITDPLATAASALRAARDSTNGDKRDDILGVVICLCRALHECEGGS